MKSRQISREGARYLVVGAWNTVFGISTFVVLWSALRNSLAYGWILLLGQIVAVLQAYWSQRTFVWKSKGPYLLELGRFSLVYVVTYFLNLTMLAVCVEWLNLPVLPSQIGITFFLIVTTFFVNRQWTFRHRLGSGARALGTTPGHPASLESRS